MLEREIQNEIQRIICSFGAEAYHPQDCGRSKIARPDIYSMNPQGPSFVIEVKRIIPKARIEPYFMPGQISWGQRDWLDRWVFSRGGRGYLGIGTTVDKRRLWIIPWENWVIFEKNYRQNIAEVPAGKDFKIPLSAITANFSAPSDEHYDYFYEFIWKGFKKGEDKNWPNHAWTIPQKHPFIASYQAHLKSDRVAISLRFDEEKEKV